MLAKRLSISFYNFPCRNFVREATFRWGMAKSRHMINGEAFRVTKLITLNN